MGSTLCCDVWASRRGGFSCRRAQASGAHAAAATACERSSCSARNSGAEAQGLWPMALLAPQREGSSWTRDLEAGF